MYKNELDRACFTHNAAHTNSKNLANWTISDKVLKDRAYEITLNSKYDGCQRELLSMVNKLFEKKKKIGSGGKTNVKMHIHVFL